MHGSMLADSDTGASCRVSLSLRAAAVPVAVVVAVVVIAVVAVAVVVAVVATFVAAVVLVIAAAVDAVVVQPLLCLQCAEPLSPEMCSLPWLAVFAALASSCRCASSWP